MRIYHFKKNLQKFFGFKKIPYICGTIKTTHSMEKFSVEAKSWAKTLDFDGISVQITQIKTCKSAIFGKHKRVYMTYTIEGISGFFIATLRLCKGENIIDATKEQLLSQANILRQEKREEQERVEIDAYRSQYLKEYAALDKVALMFKRREISDKIIMTFDEPMDTRLTGELSAVKHLLSKTQTDN